MAIFPGSAIPSAVSDYEIDNSLRFNRDDAAYLAKTFSVDGNRKKWTISTWVKITDTSTNQNPIVGVAPDANNAFTLAFQPHLDFYNYVSASGYVWRKQSSAVYRDVGAWMHVVAVLDTDNGTAEDRARLYVNGERITAWDTDSDPSSGYAATWWNDASYEHRIGNEASSASFKNGNYLAEFYCIDGSALGPDSFGSLDSDTNMWKPLDSDDVKDAVTFGTNGFYQKYNSTELGASFADSAPHTPHTVTVNGDTHTDTSVKKIGTASAQFGGAGELEITSSSDFNFGTGDFTVEFWVRFDSVSTDNQQFVFKRNSTYYGDYILWWSSSNGMTFTSGAGGSGTDVNQGGTSGWADDTWYHVALVRSGTSLNVYRDGVSIISTSNSIDFDNTGNLHIGSADGSGYFTGYIDEFRISNMARYVGAFTPSTTAFTSDQYTKLLLHCDGSDSGTTFTDSADSAPAHTITANGDATNQRPQPHDVTANGDAHLIGPPQSSSTFYIDNGASNYLSMADSADWMFGTGDFTLEMWVNTSTSGVYQYLMGQIRTDGTDECFLRIDNTNKFRIGIQGASSGASCISTSGVPKNAWTHIAAVRDGETLRVYFNGVQENTTAFGTQSQTEPIAPYQIGRVQFTSATGYYGYMDGIRISKGVCRYPDGTTFTPPTTAFVSDAQTVFLLQGGTDGSSTFTDTGNTVHTISTTGTVGPWVAPKVGAGAMAFDGTGDYFALSGGGNDWAFGTGDFTVECWIKQKSSPETYECIFDTRGSVSDTAGFIFGIKSDGAIYCYSNAMIPTSSTGVISANTWHHVALVRDGGEFEIFVDGTSVGTDSTARTFTTTAARIAAAAYDASEDFKGYMDRFRVSSIARYTSSFTPSTTAFTDDINTVLLLNADINQGTWAEDISTGLAISTESRIEFDGATDSLSIPSSSDFNMADDSWTIDFWVKFKAIPDLDYIFSQYTASGNRWDAYINNNGGTLEWTYQINDASNFQMTMAATSISLGQWYHVELGVDASTEKGYWYFDGVRQTESSSWTSTNPNVDAAFYIFNPGPSIDVSKGINGYMDEFRVSKGIIRHTGATFTPATRGNPYTADSYTKLLIHSDYTGGLGADSSGNYNNFTATNLVATDQVVDSPTNSFCTLNPLDMTWSYPTGQPIGPPTLSEGNLKSTKTSGSNGYEQSRGTIAVSSGKWYYEMYLVNAGSSNHQSFGIATTSTDSLRWWGGAKSTQWTYQNDGSTFNDDTQSSGDADTYAAGDICSIAFDCDAGKIWFAKNNTWLGSGSPNPATGADARYTNLGSIIASDGNPVAPFNVLYSSSASEFFNFGADSSFAGAVTAQGNQDGNDKGDFYYAPPSGFLALCEDNLSTPEIKLPGEYFNTALWAGNGGTQAITGVGFEPDFTWIKARDYVENHVAFDSVRTVDSILEPSSNNAAQSAGTTISQITSFDSDGFTVIKRSSGVNYVNASGNTYVGWSWKGGGAPTADNSASAGATPTAGSVKIDGANLGSALAGSRAATRLSANTTAGFSIVEFVGDTTVQTIAHGLSQKPEMIIEKAMGGAQHWLTGHDGLNEGSSPWDYYVYLSLTSADSASANAWDDTAPTSSVFTIGSGLTTGGNSPYIAYCFHSVEGYSKVGSYTGNGSVSNATNGTFIYCGFEPAYLLTKNLATGAWNILDNKRPGYNQTNLTLYANNSEAADTDVTMAVDFCSNGVKMRGYNTNINLDANNYIYMAFAESPFKYSNAR